MFKKCIVLTVREWLDDFDQNQVSQKILPMIFYDEKALNVALDNIKEYEDLIVQLGGYSLKKPVITEELKETLKNLDQKSWFKDDTFLMPYYKKVGYYDSEEEYLQYVERERKLISKNENKLWKQLIKLNDGKEDYIIINDWCVFGLKLEKIEVVDVGVEIDKLFKEDLCSIDDIFGRKPELKFMGALAI